MPKAHLVKDHLLPTNTAEELGSHMQKKTTGFPYVAFNKIKFKMDQEPYKTWNFELSRGKYRGKLQTMGIVKVFLKRTTAT